MTQDNPRLNCGYKVYLVPQEKFERLNGNFARLENCFVKNDCPHQEYLEGKFYCCSNELKEFYKE